MANPTSLPGDLIVSGDLRLGGTFSPALERSDILTQKVLQAFTIPLDRFREKTNVAMMPGTGISLGTNTVCAGSVSRVGGLIKTEIFIDVTGLNSGTDAGDIIGKTATENCNIGLISAAVNGTIVHGRITCIETPATGDPDIDFYGSATVGTGVQDAAVDDLTGETQLLDHGDWTGAEATPIAMTALPGAGYMYMVDGGGTAATYSAGKFLVELWGTPSTSSLDYVEGTFATNAPSLQTPEFRNNSAEATYYARGEVQLPWEYEEGETVKIRVSAGMLTTVASESATVDVEVYESDRDATSTGDICSTEAVSDNMNSLSFEDIDFTVTSTNLSPGDLLDVRLKVTVDDDDDADLMKGCIGSVQLLCDVR